MPSYKDSKTGKWYCQFYYKDWTGANKHKVKRGFERKKDADAWEKDFQNKFNASGELFFSKLCEKFRENYKNNNKESSYQAIDLRLQILEQSFASFKISDITPVRVLDWVNFELNNGKTPEWLRTIMTTFNAVFTFASEVYGYDNNPLKKVRRPKSEEYEEMKIWTPVQFENFLTLIKDDTCKLEFLILFFTGCREGECFALTPNDILANRTIKFTKSMMRLQNPTRYVLSNPKTYASRRNTSIPEFLYQMIISYIKSIPFRNPDDPIFETRPYRLRYYLKTYAPKIGLEPIRLHDLRHSHASMLINMGANILLVASRLGHKNPQITLRTYAHLYPDRSESIAADLNKLGMNNNIFRLTCAKLAH